MPMEWPIVAERPLATLIVHKTIMKAVLSSAIVTTTNGGWKIQLQIWTFRSLFHCWRSVGGMRISANSDMGIGDAQSNCAANRDV